VTETATYSCSICSEPSTGICVWCTKDACRNHHCHRCHRCSDCCECDVPVADSEEPERVAEPAAEPAPPEASEEPDLNTPPATVFDEDLPHNH
jgi:hypothetical protein